METHNQTLHLRMRCLQPPDIGHRRHDLPWRPLSLLTWFLAIYAVASHSNGISALQLQAQLGLGSYKTAWLMLQKLRRAMVDPDRSLLEDLVEVEESDIPWRDDDGALLRNICDAIEKNARILVLERLG